VDDGVDEVDCSVVDDGVDEVDWSVVDGEVVWLVAGVVVEAPTHFAVQLNPDLLVVSPFVTNVSERLLSDVTTPVGALTAQFF